MAYHSDYAELRSPGKILFLDLLRLLLYKNK